MTERMTISMPDELAERINSQLDYGDNRSELIREALRRGLDEIEGDGGGATTEVESSGVDRARLREIVPGQGDLAERRVDAIVAMYDELRERGTAEKQDLLAAVDVERTDYASSESVWSNLVKGRDTLKSLPGVQPPRTGRSEWRYEPE